jgi:hypothetical protein
MIRLIGPWRQTSADVIADQPNSVVTAVRAARNPQSVQHSPKVLILCWHCVMLRI